MNGITITPNGLATTSPFDVFDQLEVGDEIDQFLDEKDRRYLQRSGKSITVLTVQEAQLEDHIRAARARLAETDEAKALRELQASLKTVRAQREEKTTKGRAIIERALQDVKKGTPLWKKLGAILSGDLTAANRALPEGKR